MTIATEIKPGPFQIKGKRPSKAERTRLAASGLKRCPACGHAKLKDAFGTNTGKPGGLRYLCRDCDAADKRRYRTANPEAALATSRKQTAKVMRAKARLERAVRHFEGREDWLSRIAHEIDASPSAGQLMYVSRDLDGLVALYVYEEE